ncbi:MAG TPA: TraR/DksA C4-type zinc finger protein [Chitinophagales bacterium]|nr:TraR/DksA C4-type zinc finger protein [Chitinophagales bacterium]
MAKSKKKAAKPAKKSAGAAKKAPAKKVSKPKVKKTKPIAKKTAKPVQSSKPAKKKIIAKKPKAKAAKPAKTAPKAKVASKSPVKATEKVTSHPALKNNKGKSKAPKTRYSDPELAEFRQLIIEKLEAAKKELKYLQEQISRSGDNTADDTENKYASMDDGGSSMEREYLNQMAARQRLYLDHLDKALVRIHNKTYGICRVTGKLIDKERLRAVPHATLSMEAKLMQQHPQPANTV